MTVMDDLAEAWSYANNRPDQISEDMLIGQLIVSWSAWWLAGDK